MRTNNKMAEFKRPDGRKVDELREPIKAEVGIIENADGSAISCSSNSFGLNVTVDSELE